LANGLSLIPKRERGRRISIEEAAKSFKALGMGAEEILAMMMGFARAPVSDDEVPPEGRME
jgi:hypothetical protein